jgi:hypothetical protein
LSTAIYAVFSAAADAAADGEEDYLMMAAACWKLIILICNAVYLCNKLQLIVTEGGGLKVCSKYLAQSVFLSKLDLGHRYEVVGKL